MNVKVAIALVSGFTFASVFAFQLGSRLGGDEVWRQVAQRQMDDEQVRIYPAGPQQAVYSTVAVETAPGEVRVDTCADTGLVATRFCPEMNTKVFKKGSEPTRACPIHTGY